MQEGVEISRSPWCCESHWEHIDELYQLDVQQGSGAISAP